MSVLVENPLPGLPPPRDFFGLLPTEVIELIIDANATDPIAQFNMALTCKRLLRCARYALAPQKDLAKRFGVATDLDGYMLRDLLRSVAGIGDPLQAWHVRTMEIWEETSTWGPGISSSRTNWIWPWPLIQGEKEAYMTLFERYFNDRFFEECTRKSTAQFKAIMKMVLICILPRIRTLKFVAPARHQLHVCLYYLSHAPKDYLRDGHPPVLQSLDIISVGLTDGFRGHRSDTVDMETLLRVMCLPIRSLYVSGLEYLEGFSTESWAKDQWGNQLLPSCGRSRLEHLVLDRVRTTPSRIAINIMAQLPVALRTFAIYSTSGNELGVEEIAEAIWYNREHSLESCMVHNARFPLDGRATLICPGWSEHDMGFFMRHTFGDPSESDLSHSVGDWGTDLNDIFLSDNEVGYTNMGLSVFVVYGNDPALIIKPAAGSEDSLEDAVIRMIRHRRETGNQPLKTVYLCGFEEGEFWGGKQRSRVRFQKAILEGIKSSVDIYTGTTPLPLRHDWQHQLPGIIERPVQPADPVDPLRYNFSGDGTEGGSFGNVSLPRVFNPMTGKWDDPLCNRCGECKTCLQLYPRETWKKAQQQRDVVRRQQRGEAVDHLLSGLFGNPNGDIA